MTKLDKKTEWTLELMLVLTTLGLSSMLYYADQAQIVVLNLFFLPIVLAGFFLGRYRSGVLALLSVVSATIMIAMDLSRFSLVQSPVSVMLSIMVWGAVLGLTSILVGTLSDDRHARAIEAHEAHVGVVEVLSRYLQSADPALQSKALSVVHLAERVAQKLRLTAREIDDLKVAALLMDVENIEITARVIRKAVGHLEEEGSAIDTKTFHGTELVRSLGSVLSGASPLLLSQTEYVQRPRTEVPLGARILHSVRAFIEATSPQFAGDRMSAADALDDLRMDTDAGHDPTILFVIEELTCGPTVPVTTPLVPATTAAQA